MQADILFQCFFDYIYFALAAAKQFQWNNEYGLSVLHIIKQ